MDTIVRVVVSTGKNGPDRTLTRKILVLGELSDVGSAKGTVYAKLATRAKEVADITVFVGPWAFSGLKARRDETGDAFHAFSHVRDASTYVNSIARDGDLVLLKGSNRQNHLLRIILARNGDIACWRDDCKRYAFCNECSERGKPSGAPLLIARPRTLDGTARIESVDTDQQVVVGLGNPEPRYVGSPHNIGYEVLDLLAKMWGLTWTEMPEAWIARGMQQDRSVCLIKIRLAMNGVGAGLKRFSDTSPVAPQQSILVHDDLNLPIGTVRARLSGGAGGHRGVASILEAFQTDSFRRVKLGIGQAGARNNQVEYVLKPWDTANRAVIDEAIRTAAVRVAEMVATQSKAP